MAAMTGEESGIPAAVSETEKMIGHHPIEPDEVDLEVHRVDMEVGEI